MTIIDTHVHLYDIPGVVDVLCEAAAEGVSDVVALGVDLASNKRHLEISARVPEPGSASGVWPRIHLALGIHPANIIPEEVDACLAFFRENIRRSVAIGETGMDFSYKDVSSDDAKKDEQRRVFQLQLDLARECDLPIVIHSRGAWREALDMTVRAGVRAANFHWYTGPVDVLKDTLDAGYVISLSPALEYSADVRRAAEFAPLDRILVETDTPTRGWKPRDVWRTLRLLAALKGLDAEKALSAVNANARGFFRI